MSTYVVEITQSDFTASRTASCMTRHLHLAPLATQHALLVDQKRAALDAHELAPVHALLLEHAEKLAHGFFFIGE